MSNLACLGPDLGAPAELRYAAVGQYLGQYFDLMVRSTIEVPCAETYALSHCDPTCGTIVRLQDGIDMGYSGCESTMGTRRVC